MVMMTICNPDNPAALQTGFSTQGGPVSSSSSGGPATSERELGKGKRKHAGDDEDVATSGDIATDDRSVIPWSNRTRTTYLTPDVCEVLTVTLPDFSPLEPSQYAWILNYLLMAIGFSCKFNFGKEDLIGQSSPRMWCGIGC